MTTTHTRPVTPVTSPSPLSFELQRANMVDGQLRPHKVNDKAVLARFATLPRENFVSPEALGQAYLDQPVPVSPDREMFMPLIAARLVQALSLQASDHVLVLAGGSGYSAAVIAGLVESGSVTLVESDGELATRARASLAAFANATVVQAAPTALPASPHGFDAILLDAPAAEIPPAILAGLREGGRLTAICQNASGILEGILFTRQGKTVFQEILFDTKGTILPAFARAERFTF